MASMTCGPKSEIGNRKDNNSKRDEIGNKGAQITADDITINPAHEALFSKLPEP